MDKPSINWCRILADFATIHTIPVWVVIISPSTTARQRGRQGTLLPVGQRVRLGPLEATGHVTPAGDNLLVMQLT